MSRKFVSPPVTPRAQPELAAAEIVMNPETGAIIHAKNADVQRDPASLTKLATAYMVLRAVERGEIKLDQQIKISSAAAALDNNTLQVPTAMPDGSSARSDRLPEGARMTVREALTVMVTGSANGVARALGEALAPQKLNAKGKPVPGSERDFAREMTRVAHEELGMNNTSFINASGLNDGGPEQRSNLSTARDMAILSQRLMKDFPQFEKLTSSHTATSNILLPDGERLRVNSPTTSHFVRDFDARSARAQKEGFFATGPQKTGFNRLSGGINLLSTAQNMEGVRLTSVVLGGRDSDSRYVANLKNLRGSFAKLDSDPQFAAVYRGAAPETMVAAVSPAAAFAEPKAGKRADPARAFAHASSEPPRQRFNRASQQRSTNPAPAVQVAARPAMKVEDIPAFVPVEAIDISALSSHVALDTPAPEQPEIQRISYRPPGNE